MFRTLDLRRPAYAPNREPHSSRETCVLTLEIRRGPSRTSGGQISGKRLLIGSDGACDVRLDPVEAPALHTLAHVDRDGVWIEAVADDPPLLVNGKAVESARLKDADLVQIGSFECVARVGVVTLASNAIDSRSSIPPARRRPHRDVRAADAASLTASELADRLEEDTELVERHDAALHLGLRALLEAARSQASNPDGAVLDARGVGEAEAPVVVRWDAMRARVHSAGNPWNATGVSALARQIGQLVESLQSQLDATESSLPPNVGDALTRAAHELQVLHDRLAEPDCGREALCGIARTERAAA